MGEAYREGEATVRDGGKPASDPLLMPILQTRTSRWVGEYPSYSAEELRQVARALDAQSVSQRPPKWNVNASGASFVAEAEAFRVESSGTWWSVNAFPRLTFFARRAVSIPWHRYTPKCKGWPYWASRGDVGEWLEDRWLLRKASPPNSSCSYGWNRWGETPSIHALVADVELERLHEALRDAVRDSTPWGSAFYVVRAARRRIDFRFHCMPQDVLLLGKWLRTLSSCKNVALRIVEICQATERSV